MNAETLANRLSDANLDMESTIGKARALTWSLLHALDTNTDEANDAALALAECLAETLAPKRGGR